MMPTLTEAAFNAISFDYEVRKLAAVSMHEACKARRVAPPRTNKQFHTRRTPRKHVTDPGCCNFFSGCALATGGRNAGNALRECRARLLLLTFANSCRRLREESLVSELRISDRSFHD